MIFLHDLQRGDSRAFRLFYTQHAPALFRYLQKKIATLEDCEEILQDIFVAFSDGMREFRGSSSVKTYLYAIAHNKIVDYYRKKRMKQFVFSKFPFLEDIFSVIGNPEEELQRGFVREAILSVLSKLEPMHQQVIRYKYIENRSVSDIAQKLAVSIKSVESHLFRARKAFVILYEKEY